MKKFIIYLSTISFFFLLNPQTCFSQFGFVGKSKAWIKTNLQDVWTLKNTNTSNDGTEYESYINPRNGDEMTFYYNSKGFCSKIIIFTKYDNLTSFTNHFNKTCVSIVSLNG
jgi:hypothetical protein